MNSHILQEVELVCTRVAIMAKGKLLANAPLSELRLQSSSQDQLEIDIIASDELRADTKECETKISECFRIPAFSEDVAHSFAKTIVRLASRDATYRVCAHPADQHRDSIHAQSASPRSAVSIDQPAVDQIVDRLRNAGFSIARLERKGPTLEETFIRLVSESEEKS